MNHKVLSVHYLRGFAALLIVASHYAFYLPKSIDNIFGSGGVGVDIFFIISGFIITYATRHQSDTLYTFSIKRFFRIYPLLIITWVLFVLTIYHDVSLVQKIQSLFLFMNDYNGSHAPAFGFNLMGPPWTLTYEVLFYAIFGISMAMSHKYRTLISGLVIILAVFGLQFIYNGKISLSSQESAMLVVNHWWQVPAKILSTTILFEFIVGMALCEIFIRTKEIKLSLLPIVILIAGVVVFAVLFVNAELRPLGLRGGLWVALSIFIPFIVYDKLKGFGNSRFLTYLGDISYSMYISHFILLMGLMHYTPNILDYVNRYALYFMLLLSCLVISDLLHRFIEVPCIKIGKKIYASRELKNKSAIEKRA